ncbi:Adhesion G protein-coupled receptor L3-like 4, partial [Homarus americanus]
MGPFTYCWSWNSHKVYEETPATQTNSTVPSGVVIVFSVQRLLGISKSEVEAYIPWQLHFEATSTSVLVEWAQEENVSRVCYYSPDGVQCDTGMGFDRPYSIINNTLMKQVQNCTVFQETYQVNLLMNYQPTEDNYVSLAWRCNDEKACGDKGHCFPATESLVHPNSDHVHPNSDHVPAFYPYTCRCLDDSCLPNPEDITVPTSSELSVDEGYLVIAHADFSTYKTSSYTSLSSTPTCTLPTALAILKYWCDGKRKCHIEYERLLSYLQDHVCHRNTDVDDFILTVRQNAVKGFFKCREGMQLYNNTCFGYGTPDDIDFDTGRYSCLLMGGDLAYYIINTQFLDMWEEEWWTLGVESEARPQKLFTWTVDQAYVSGDRYFHCGNNCTNSTRRALCALPPLDISIKNHNTSLPLPDNTPCRSGPCMNGATCLPASEGLGLASQTFNSFMCRCPPEYSGLYCERHYEGVCEELISPSDDEYRFSTGNASLVWVVEFAYFGHNSSMHDHFLGCYSPSAVTLLRLRCDGQTNCIVLKEDLHHHLPSSCHPVVTPHLSVRLAVRSVDDELTCPQNGTLVNLPFRHTRTCLLISDTFYNDFQKAKLDCNTQGGDLAKYYIHYDEYPSICTHDGDSFWTEHQQEVGSPDFTVYVRYPSLYTCKPRISHTIYYHDNDPHNDDPHNDDPHNDDPHNDDPHNDDDPHNPQRRPPQPLLPQRRPPQRRPPHPFTSHLVHRSSHSLMCIRNTSGTKRNRERLGNSPAQVIAVDLHWPAGPAGQMVIGSDYQTSGDVPKMLDLLGGAQDRHKKDIDELEDPEQVLNITKHDNNNKIELPEGYELNRSTAECVWWDADNNSWSSSGCRFTYFNLTFSKCSCNHLTNFAIIMDINGVVNPDDVLLGWITCLGCSLSLVCLAVAIVTLITHKLKCQRSASAKTTRIIRVNICACLFVSEVVLLAGLDKTENEAGCAVVAGFLHYFLLAYFFWMGVEGVNVYFLLVRVFQTSRSPLRYYLASGYGLPALIVAISAGVRYNGYGTKTFCWLDPNYHGLIWAFSGPALCILLVNVVMFTLGMRVLLRQRPGEPSRNKKEARQRKKQLLKSSFTLATLMGLTWLTGYLYVSKGSEALEVLFTLVASLQGVVLFLVLETQRRKKSLATGFTMDYSSESIPINPRGSSELDISVARDIQDRQVIQNPPSCGGEDQQIIFTVKVPITPRGSSELDIHVARDCKNNKSSDRQGGQYRIESSDRQDRQDRQNRQYHREPNNRQDRQYHREPSDRQGSPYRREPSDRQGSPHRREPSDRQGSPHRREPSDRQGSPYRREPSDRQGSPYRREPRARLGSPYRREPSDRLGSPYRREPSDRQGSPYRREPRARLGSPYRREPSDRQGSPYRREPSDRQGSPDRREPSDRQGSPYRREPSDRLGSPDRREPSDRQGSPYHREPSDRQGSPYRREPSDRQGSPYRREPSDRQGGHIKWGNTDQHNDALIRRR